MGVHSKTSTRACAASPLSSRASCLFVQPCWKLSMKLDCKPDNKPAQRQVRTRRRLTLVTRPLSLLPFTTAALCPVHLACPGHRWEGRPRTPPFKWGDEGEVIPPHDTWLIELDLKQEGISALVDADAIKDNPTGLDNDLRETKKLLVQYAGMIHNSLLHKFWKFRVFQPHPTHVTCDMCYPIAVVAAHRRAADGVLHSEQRRRRQRRAAGSDHAAAVQGPHAGGKGHHDTLSARKGGLCGAGGWRRDVGATHPSCLHQRRQRLSKGVLVG